MWRQLQKLKKKNKDNRMFGSESHTIGISQRPFFLFVSGSNNIMMWKEVVTFVMVAFSADHKSTQAAEDKNFDPPWWQITTSEGFLLIHIHKVMMKQSLENQLSSFKFWSNKPPKRREWVEHTQQIPSRINRKVCLHKTRLASAQQKNPKELRFWKQQEKTWVKF